MAHISNAIYQGHWPFGSREENLKRFLPYMGVVTPWWPSLSCDQEHLRKLSLAHVPKESPYEI